MSLRRSRIIPVVAGLIVIYVTVQLGNWQLRRADEKRAIQEQIEAGAQLPAVDLAELDEAPHEWMRIRVRGEWFSEGIKYYDNRVYRGQPGYYVHMPLKLVDDGGWLLVSRGWIAAGRDRAVLPEIETADGEVRIEGVVRVPEQEPFSLASDPRDGLRWQYVDLDAYREWSELPVKDWVLQQQSEAGDALVRDWPSPDVGIDQHHGYAFQWFSLALLALGLTGYYVFRSFRKNAA